MFTVTARESVYTKGLPAPPRHSILPPLIQTPGGRRGEGAQQVPCEWLLTCSRLATCYSNTFTGARAGSYVKRPHTLCQGHGLRSGCRVSRWVRQEIGRRRIYSISCNLCLPLHCLHAAFKWSTMSCNIVNTPVCCQFNIV